MRVNKGDQVDDARWIVGVITEDADDRQGYFWLHRCNWYWGIPEPSQEDICVPFAAIAAKKRVALGKLVNIRLTISRDEMDELPQRWQVRPQPTVAEMVQALPFAGTPRRAALPPGPSRPLSGTVIPAPPGQGGDRGQDPNMNPNPFANLALSAQAQALVAEQFTKTAAIITEMAKIEQATQSEAVSDCVKAIAHQETMNAYGRLQAINQWTDMEISRVLQQASARAAQASLPVTSGSEEPFATETDPEGSVY